MRAEKEQLELEAVMHTVHEGNRLLARVREGEADDRAVARCLERSDTMKAELREDGTILCTGYNGRVVLRPRGFRGR